MSTHNVLVNDATQHLLKLLAISLREVAEAIDVSHDTIRGWSYGRSAPSPENREKLLNFVREHAQRLDAAADEL
jgi:DNA-binding transcriptional regulator YiaG